MNRLLKKMLFTFVATLLVTAGLATVTTVAASAHTGDLPVTAECNKVTGEYDFTAKLVLSNVPDNKTGTTKWRIGTSSFQGTPTSDSGMDRGPITSVGNQTKTLVGTASGDVKFSLPGTTTGYGPWFYAFTKWSGSTKGSDGQLKDKLKGDCKKSTEPNPPKQDITCTGIYRDFGRALKNGDHINVTIERQNGTQYQVNVYVDRNIAGGYDTLGFRYSDGTTRPLTETEVKKGRIWLDLSAKVSDKYYKVQFVQINESENWPKLECGTPKTDKPDPVVEQLVEDKTSCEIGYKKRTGTKTTDWIFDEKSWKWVAGTPVISWNDWIVRDLTPQEKKQLDCDKPGKPESLVKKLFEDKKSCEYGYQTRTGTETTNWVFDEKTWTWVQQAPVTQWNNWVVVRELTSEEKKQLDCTKPDKPQPVVEPLVDDRKSCESGVEQRTGTKTTDWIFDEKSWKWVAGTPVVSWGNWTFVRDLTVAEQEELGCLTEAVPTAPSSGDFCEPVTGSTQDRFTVPQDRNFTYLWNGGVVAPGTYPAPHKLYRLKAVPVPGVKLAAGAVDNWTLRFTKKDCVIISVVRGAVKSVDKCRTNGDRYGVRFEKGVVYAADGRVIRKEGVWLKTGGDRKIVIKAKAASGKYKLVGKTRWVLKFSNKPCGSTPTEPPDTGHRLKVS